MYMLSMLCLIERFFFFLILFKVLFALTWNISNIWSFGETRVIYKNDEIISQNAVENNTKS